MIRTEAYRVIDGYRDIPEVRGVEDYDLWFRLYAKGYRGYVLGEPLYSMFDGRDAAHRRSFQRRLNEYWVRKQGYALLGISWWKRLYQYKPIVLAFIPQWLYRIIRPL
jgi:glycosyltransferase EpsE